MLDDITGVQYGGETPIEGGGVRSCVQSDTPQQGVYGYQHITVYDHFQTYLMYKYGGDSANSIWVTLQTLSWSWNATGDLGTNGIWTLSGTSLTNSPSSDSTTLPQWNGIGQHLQVVPE